MAAKSESRRQQMLDKFSMDMVVLRNTILVGAWTCCSLLLPRVSEQQQPQQPSSCCQLLKHALHGCGEPTGCPWA
jgi:hypothetical protein